MHQARSWVVGWAATGAKPTGNLKNRKSLLAKCVQPRHPCGTLDAHTLFSPRSLEEINVDASEPRLAVAPPQMEEQSMKCEKRNHVGYIRLLDAFDSSCGCLTLPFAYATKNRQGGASHSLEAVKSQVSQLRQKYPPWNGLKNDHVELGNHTLNLDIP